MYRTVPKRLSLLLCTCMLLACTKYDANPPSPLSEPTVAQDISFLDINAFAQDSLGYMWIATLGGLDRYNGYDFRHFSHQASDTTSLCNDFVFSLLIDSSHRLWVGTSTGLDRFDFSTGRFERYSSRFITPVYSFFEATDGTVWVATPQGPGWIDHAQRSIVFAYKPQSVNLFWEDKSHHLWMGLNENKGMAVLKDNKTWHYYTLPQNRRVTCNYTDPQGRWWLGTNRGIVLFDPSSRTFGSAMIPVLQNEQLNNTQINFIKEIEPLKLLIGTTTEGFFYYDIVSQTLQHNMPMRFNPLMSPQLHTCYKDRQDNIWIGSYDKGFMIENKHKNNFNTDPQLSNLLNGNFVTRIVEDTDRNLWIATRYNGLYRYSATKEIRQYTSFRGNGFLEDLFIDSQRRIWIAFERQLLVAQLSANGDIRLTRQYAIDNVRVVKEDRQGNIWLGSWNGLFRIGQNDAPGQAPRKIFTSNIPDICLLRSGDLLFSAYGRGIFRIGRHTDRPTPIRFPQAYRTVVQSCVTLYEDAKQRVWVGSYGNGALCYKGRSYTHFSVQNGLPNNNTLCFREDVDENVWVSTSRGIARIATWKNRPKIKSFFKVDGTLGDQYHEKAGCRTADGRIFFAGNHGLTFFNPLNIRPDTNPPAVNIEDLKIFNRHVQPAQKGSPLQQDILQTKEITLDHRQTTLSLDYAGIDFLGADKLTYKYRLNGFEKQWNYVGHFRRASYSNLPAGQYLFEVCAINGDGIESTHPATLKITVKPAPWLTWQAWLLYVLCAITLTVLILRFWIKTKLNRQQIEFEHNERNREKQIAQMKMTFFTNISHELRTPLTLISAPLDQILAAPADTDNRPLLNTIARNVKRMWQLANQLLDLSKIENGVMKLHVQPTDIIAQITNIYHSFTYIAERKDIQIELKLHAKQEIIWLDSDKLDKILYNLLSNAIKHSPQYQPIAIETRIIDKTEAQKRYQRTADCTRFVEIHVTDHGKGIAEDKMKNLFVRYQQIETDSGTMPDYSGNGIGLHYTKTLVETHKGSIRAENRAEGGMDFAFILPATDIYTDKEKKEMAPELFITPHETENTARQAQQNSKREQTHTLLIAEDNLELLDFIESILEKKYRVIKTADGEQAWQQIQKTMPDLVLSDVIMPHTSGYELCTRIKQSLDYCHIPVVLLTAKTIMADQVEGLDCGADAYICKPFNTDYLLLTIRNMLRYKEQLYQYFSTPQVVGRRIAEMPCNNNDSLFMEKLTQLIEREMANTELNIDDIAQQLGYSRSVFYRRLKSLTNTPPNDFLRIYRLKRAAEKIILRTDSLADVAEQTGFVSYPYFSKAFKKHFGTSPKDYYAATQHADSETTQK